MLKKYSKFLLLAFLTHRVPVVVWPQCWCTLLVLLWHYYQGIRCCTRLYTMFYEKRTKYMLYSNGGDSGYSICAEDTLIGAELVQKMFWLVRFKIKRAFCILRVLKNPSDSDIIWHTALSFYKQQRRFVFYSTIRSCKRLFIASPCNNNNVQR